MRLLALPHRTVELLAEPPAVGDLVCFPGYTKVSWRRVLEVGGDRLRVRGDVAPREDGWIDARLAIGRARPPGMLSIDTLAHLAPSVWTQGLYQLATLLANARARAAHIRRRRRAPRSEPDAIRVLTEADRELYAQFHKERSDSEGVVRALPEPCDSPIAVGLFSGHSDLVGTQILEWHSKEACYFHTFYVTPSARGMGVGGRMKAFAIATAKIHGAKRARCFVHARNAQSIAANTRAGMRLTGEWLTERDDPLSTMTHQLVEMAIDL